MKRSSFILSCLLFSVTFLISCATSDSSSPVSENDDDQIYSGNDNNNEITDLDEELANDNDNETSEQNKNDEDNNPETKPDEISDETPDTASDSTPTPDEIEDTDTNQTTNDEETLPDEESKPLSPYGMIESIDYATPYILSGNGKSSDHPESIVTKTAFRGYYGTNSDVLIPDKFSESEMKVITRHYPIYQNPQVEILQQGTYYPDVYLTFPNDTFSAGTMKLGVDKTEAKLIVVTTVNGTECIEAVAFGEFNIESAVNVNKSEGGSLEIEGNNILLYYPTETPSGSVSSILYSLYKKNTCPKR